MSGEPSYQFVVCYTPHTTVADAAFVVREVERFRPHVYIPEEPIRPREKVDATHAYYERLISGEEDLESGRPNRAFHQTILEFLRQYRTSNPLCVYFLELYPLEDVRHLGVLRKREEEERKSAWSLFYRGELDEACERLFTSLHLQAHGVRIRACTFQENLANLERDLRERYPQLNRGSRVLTWISDLYAPPIIQFDAVIPNVEEVKQSDPYTHLTHVDIIRGLLFPKPEPVDFNVLPRYFVENIVEEAHRESIPDSVERFSLCRHLSSQLSYTDVKFLARRSGDREHFLKSLDEIRISKVGGLPKNIGDDIMQNFGLKKGPEVGKCIQLIKSAISRGELPTNPTNEECIEFLRRGA